MAEQKLKWREDLKKHIKEKYPEHGSLGVDMLNGLTVALLTEKVIITPTLDAQVRNMVSVFNEAQSLVRYLEREHDTQEIVRELKRV